VQAIGNEIQERLLSVACWIGLREAELPTLALLIVDFQFSMACPSLEFSIESRQSKAPKIWPGILFSVSALLGRDAV
jgi:hypothetical protein